MPDKICPDKSNLVWTTTQKRANIYYLNDES